MDEVKKTQKTSLAHINEIQMTCKEHCHTTDTYCICKFSTTLRNRNILLCGLVWFGNSKLNCMRQYHMHFVEISYSINEVFVYMLQ